MRALPGIVQYFVLFTVFCLPFSLWSATAQGYPEFIAYGYTSCVTCHYNTQGNGPLNDYGRALFAGEISARDVFEESTADDDLGQNAGFFGKKEVAWWLRPAAKYRTLWANTNPGSTQNTKNLYLMQEEGDITILFNREQKLLFTGGLSYVSVVSGLQKLPNPNDDMPYQAWVSREAYFRWQARKELFISAGMIEKVFGLRDADHTQFNRVYPQLGQYQTTIGTLTHGVVVQWNTPEHEYTINPFMGNLMEDNSLRQRGLAAMAEYTTAEKGRTGFGAIYQFTPTQTEQAFEVHEKYGLTVGSSVLAELGFVQVQDSQAGSNLTGYYGIAETMILLRRGYNFISDMEYFKSRTDAGDNPDSYRWGLGLLAFPLPRVEVRITAIDGRPWEATNGDKDSWTLLGQFHLSL